MLATAVSNLRLRAAATLIAAVLIAFALMAFVGVPRAAAASCGSTSALPGTVSGQALQSATVCLLNRARARSGLRRLRVNGRLSLAARRHAVDMVRRDYFSHYSLSGASFLDRIRRTGYLRGARRWAAGENIAWGAGRRATPAAIVKAWMGSPPHRANILSRRYREIGIGIARGAPGWSGLAALTYVTEFGRR
jgi:uncharacterized protein YkwD